MSSINLKGKVAVITGASKGLGKSIALSLAEAGADIALISRDISKLNEVAAEASRFGNKALCYKADVTDESQVNSVATKIIQDFKTVHILVNNAGINLRKSITDFSLDEYRKVMDTNMTGAFLMCRAFVPYMRANGYGRIINLTSIMSHVGLPGRSIYAASKSALLGFTKALALELAPDKITVNGISPGPFLTEMNKPLLDNPEITQFFLSRIPLGRWGEPKEVGALALYLCSEDASFITGADILIDGGWTAQ
ncbi:MAG: SDR family NAD(P)-dependent oxidoreductase [Verrucomicrobiia bacterium]|jgi:NAD(P)-dependent dehydrogenase (short-subunit alcohol dehydrogenase family)